VDTVKYIIPSLIWIKLLPTSAILSKQIPDVEKCKLADFIINTDYPEYSSAKAQVAQVIESIIERNQKIFNLFFIQFFLVYFRRT
jgi:hypothetical protein